MQSTEATQPPTHSEAKTPRILTSLELFAGAGGLALGTHAAGFKHLGLIERDPFAVQTLRDNSQRVLGLTPNLILHQDARNVDYKKFAGKVDLLSGGPPCQPFSGGGLAKGSEDQRDMFPTFLHAVAEIMPHAILVENVKGLLRPKFRDYFNYILKCLQFPICLKKDDESWINHYKRLLTFTEKSFAHEEQYIVTYQPVNTADFGIPQIRERVIIIAFRRDLAINNFRLEITHSKEALFIDQWITKSYWERYDIPPHNYLGPTDKELAKKLRKQLSLIAPKQPWLTTRDAIHDLPIPVERGQEEQTPNHIQHPGARTYPGHSGSPLDHPSKALKAGDHGTPGGENIICIPPENTVRYLTIREAARLQTFPDEWYFHGSWGACIKQLGNAVPTEIIKIFSQEISQRLLTVLA